MEGLLTGVFGSGAEDKTNFEESVAKKSETEGITIYGRTEGPKKVSFLDDRQFPERIQGYSRIASIVDYAFLIYPSQGKLATSDGELAVLIDSFGLSGSIVVPPNGPDPLSIKNSLKGLSLENYPVDVREKRASILDTSRIKISKSFPPSGTLIYIDRAFNVKGVGLVVLGFILSGSVRVHDNLRVIPSEGLKLAEVRGIQLSDVDQESAGRGVRVGLSLKGVELKDLEKATWLDDSSFTLSDKLRLNFKPSKFYKQSVADRDVHVQLPGQLLVAKIARNNSEFQAKLASQVPLWQGMKLALIDLNAKMLRVAGGADVIL